METKVKQKVLVVEDEGALRNVLEDKLKAENFSVLLAKDGAEGLDVALKNHPDLILLDIIMPKMNGLVMLKKIRGDSWGKAVPVLLLTNDSNPEHIGESLKVNASDYLIKSDWSLDDVVKKIISKLKR